MTQSRYTTRRELWCVQSPGECGKDQHIGVSNFNFPLLEQALNWFQTKLVTHQVYYNPLARKLQENGTLKFCQQNNIVLTAYVTL